MTIKVRFCVVCHKQFEYVAGPAHPPQYCSEACRQVAKKDYRKLYYEQLYGIKPKRKKPKTYEQIVAWNKAHPLKDGWRGQPVIGGANAARNYGETSLLTWEEQQQPFERHEKTEKARKRKRKQRTRHAKKRA